jgi:hypothetical protein
MEEDEDDSKGIWTPPIDSDLAEESVMDMNSISSPLTICIPSIDLNWTCNDKSTNERRPTLVKSCRRSRHPSNSARSLKLAKSEMCTQKNEAKTRERLCSSAYTFTCLFREESQDVLTIHHLHLM